MQRLLHLPEVSQTFTKPTFFAKALQSVFKDRLRSEEP